MSGNPPAPSTLADALQSVNWEYEGAVLDLSPLVATDRYFQSFPWDGEESLPADSARVPEPASPG
jgi:hypothetical protein